MTTPARNGPSALSPHMNPSGTVLWLLGPTSAGKTTLATRILADLRERGVPAIHLDGDEVRDFFGDGLGFGPDSRLRVVSVLVHLANKAADAGLNVVVSALTASEDARAHVRTHVSNLTVGYVACSIPTCAKRDPKGLYEKAIKGEISYFTGITSPYEEPSDPELVLETDWDTEEVLVERVIEALQQDGIVDL
jgi:adenylylsulfate kinase